MTYQNVVSSGNHCISQLKVVFNCISWDTNKG